MKNCKISFTSLAVIIFISAFFHELNASPYWSQFSPPEKTYDSSVSAAPCFVLPQGNMNQYSEYGWGFMIAYSQTINNFIITFKTGSLYFPGKEKDFGGSTESITDYFVMIPFTAGIGYKFEITSWFSIVPNINAGVSFDILKSTPDGISALGGVKYSTSSALHPVSTGGVDLVFDISKRLSLRLSAAYTAVYEFQGGFTMANLAVSSLGADWSF